MLYIFNKINSILSNIFINIRLNNLIIKISLFLSCAYFIIQFIDNVFLFKKNLGDEWYFTRDLIFFLENGYNLSVINGFSIPFTLFSSFIHTFLNDISMSLRLTNAIIVFFLILYVFVRKKLLATNDKKIFIIHLLMLIGTTGGLFYGTNDSFFAVSFFILCSECYLYLKGERINRMFMVIIYSIFIMSRPHFIIYFPILILSYYIFSIYREGWKIKNIFNPIIISFFISLLIVSLFNYPKIINNNFSHNQGTYIPKFLFISYADKSTTYKTDDPEFSWTQWTFYSQMVSNNKRFGLFAPLVDWSEVRDYKIVHGGDSLPESYQEYILQYFPSVIKRIPISITEVSLLSIRYVGCFLLCLPFWLFFKIREKSNNPLIFISILFFVGIIVWMIIWPTTIGQARFMPFYTMLLILVTDKSNFNFNIFNKNYLMLNLIIMDFITIWALWKWEIFRSI